MYSKSKVKAGEGRSKPHGQRQGHDNRNKLPLIVLHQEMSLTFTIMTSEESTSDMRHDSLLPENLKAQHLTRSQPGEHAATEYSIVPATSPTYPGTVV